MVICLFQFGSLRSSAFLEYTVRHVRRTGLWICSLPSYLLLTCSMIFLILSGSFFLSVFHTGADVHTPWCKIVYCFFVIFLTEARLPAEMTALSTSLSTAASQNNYRFHIHYPIRSGLHCCSRSSVNLLQILFYMLSRSRIQVPGSAASPYMLHLPFHEAEQSG